MCAAAATYGRAWHEAAIKTRRQNAFDDYIAAARWLVAAGYTTPARLVSRGNSNGGLLVAVAAMQAPDAFGAVFCRAPILDMLRISELATWARRPSSMARPTIRWRAQYLAGYSPYHNVRADRRYPLMVFVPALNDRNAPPYDPLKMVARLQAEAAQGGPLPAAAAARLGARRRHHAVGAGRAGCRRAELLLLGARCRAALGGRRCSDSRYARCPPDLRHSTGMNSAVYRAGDGCNRLAIRFACAAPARSEALAAPYAIPFVLLAGDPATFICRI